MIKLADLLKEISTQIKLGKKLGSGGNFTAYEYPSNPDKIIKVPHDPKSNSIQDHVEMFKKYPKYFPKVYDVTDEYLVLEKLDTKPILELEQKLQSLLKKFLTLKNPDLPKSIRKVYLEDPYLEYGEEDLSSNVSSYIGTFKPNKNTYNSNWSTSNEFNYIVRQDPQILKQITELHQLYISVYKILKKWYSDPEPSTDFSAENIGVDTQGNYKMVDF
jgi:hypothetical protein